MKLGVIGFGNMGGAIVRGALKRGTLRKEDVNVYDILDAKMLRRLNWVCTFRLMMKPSALSQISYCWQ